MNPDAFTPSIDWSNELAASTVWVLQVSAITAVCLLVVLVIVGRTTRWGRQFWRVTGDYFSGTQSIRVWALLAFLLVSIVIDVRITVLLSYYGNDLFTALQVTFQSQSPEDAAARTAAVAGFWSTILVFAVLAGCHVVRLVADLYVTQRFIMRWRIWLSRRVAEDWLGDAAHYRSRFLRQPIDNPDQRIQQDVDIFTTGVGGLPNNPAYGSGHLLLFGAVQAMLSVFSFSVILWQLSGPLTVFDVTLPRALFWIVIGYVLVVTVVAFVIGRPLIRLSFVNELRNASFRYALVRLRDAGTAVGLYRGERVEGNRVAERLTSVMDNYRRWLNRMVLFLGFNVSMSQAINPLPYIVQAQRLFSQQISLGGVMQSATAFGVIHDSLSFFRNAYDEFASFRAAIIRLDGLTEENARARALGRIETTRSPDGSLLLDDVGVYTPTGDRLVDSLSLRLQPGEMLVIKGPSGIGKSVLLQSLAGLWPYVSGRVSLPSTREATMFVPQLPYVPLGDLRTVVSYPNADGTVDDRDIQRTLVKVALSHLVIQLNDVKDWAKVLSVGEQQRIAFARVLLARPDTVFLDESTSALDEGLELMLYELIRTELPDTLVVSVSHRPAAEQFCDRRLDLAGSGRWALTRLATDS